MIDANIDMLIQQCANGVPPSVMRAVVSVESTFNPYAIGVVRGRLSRQPRNVNEALLATKALRTAGKNYSMGLAQVNKQHIGKWGLTHENIFEPCRNINAGARILADCYNRATRAVGSNKAWNAALSCYYSGNFNTGFKPDFAGQPSYVTKVNLAMNGKYQGGMARNSGTGNTAIYDIEGMMVDTRKQKKNTNIQASSNEQMNQNSYLPQQVSSSNESKKSALVF